MSGEANHGHRRLESWGGRKQESWLGAAHRRQESMYALTGLYSEPDRPSPDQLSASGTSSNHRRQESAYAFTGLYREKKAGSGDQPPTAECHKPTHSRNPSASFVDR